jgi:predicted MFS family arabinose efflux permease
MGAFAAYAAGVQLAASLGWRGAFLGFGLLGVLFAPLCWLILREPRRSVRAVSLPNSQERSSSALRALSQKRSFVGICLASIIYNIAAAGDVVFGVSYLTRVLKLDVTVYGTILGFVVAGATLVGSAGGGAVLAVLSRRDPAWLVKAPALVVILSVPVIAWGYLATEPALYFTSYFILMAGIAALAPGIISALQMVAGSSRRAMAFATLTLLVTLFGQGLGPPIVGAISDYLSAEWGPAEGLRYALLLSAMLYIPAGIVFWIAGNSVVRDTEA